MPVTIKSKPSKRLERSKGVAPKLRPAQGKTATFDELDGLLGRDAILKGYTLPDLTKLGLDVQGMPKANKSTLMGGFAENVMFKFPDGEPAIRRCRAKVVVPRDLGHFEELMTQLLSYAVKHGRTTKYKMVTLDPIGVLCRWLMEREVADCNTQITKKHGDQTDDNGNSIPPPLIDHVSEIPVFGIYSKIADYIISWLGRFKAAQWGWATITHYRWKPIFQNGVPRGSEWKADVPPTTADAIAGISDMLMVGRKLDGGPDGASYWLEFLNDKIEQLGGRVPLYGSLQLSNYDDPEVPANLTNSDEFKKQYRKARKHWAREEARFQQAEEDAAANEDG